MKNLIKNKTILLLAFCLTGIVFLTTSCKDTKTEDAETLSEQENITNMEIDDETILVVENNEDAKFLMEAAEMQVEEISLGKLAQEKGNSQHVKALGKMMVEDHSKSLTELTALSQAKSVAIPTTNTEDSQENYKKLADKSGNDFGKAYSKMMVEHHKDAISLFEKAATDSEDQEIRTWAANKLPSLKKHLEHAEKCKEECDKMKS